jgi:hypothetical protein
MHWGIVFIKLKNVTITTFTSKVFSFWRPNKPFIRFYICTFHEGQNPVKILQWRNQMIYIATSSSMIVLITVSLTYLLYVFLLIDESDEISIFDSFCHSIIWNFLLLWSKARFVYMSHGDKRLNSLTLDCLPLFPIAHTRNI